MSQEYPSMKFEEIKKFLMKMGTFMGLAILDEGYKTNIVTYILITSISFYCCASVWTLMWIHRDDFFQQAEIVCLYGMVISGIAKCFSIVSYREKYLELYKDTENIFRVNDHILRRSRILMKSMRKTIKMSYAMVLLLAFCAALYSIYPIYCVLVKQERILFVNCRFPFINSNTFLGFWITNLTLMFFASLAIVGSIGYDMFYQVLICCYTARVELLKDSLNQLNHMWIQDDRPSFDKYFYLRNIIKSFDETDRYVDELRKLILPAVTVQVFCSSFAIALSLFVIVANDWMHGYGYVFFLLIQLLMVSFLGTIVEDTRDELTAICYDCKWYLFSVREQKLILILLFKSQNAKLIQIGGYYPLNVETGLAILQTIYKFLMMLLKFLEQ